MGTVSKAMSLLKLFNHTRLEIRLSDMARLADMDKATTHRLLTQLKDAGILEQIGPERLYRLGPEILRLASLREAAVPLLESAKKILNQLAQQTSETAHFSLLRGQSLISAAHVYGQKYATGVMIGDKESHPLHATSSGLVILAFSITTFVEDYLSHPLTRHTKHTETDPDKIRAMLPHIRANGYAESVSGFEDNVHSFSAPIFNRSMKPIGAISVAAPSDRVGNSQRKKTALTVKQCALTLTRETGGISPASYPNEVAA